MRAPSDLESLKSCSIGILVGLQPKCLLSDGISKDHQSKYALTKDHLA